MKITFWGVRGSIPTPGESTVRYGGNTTSLECIAAAGETYILDAGSGIIGLGNSLMARHKGKVNAKILITHEHYDHIQGFPFFVPAYVPGCEIEVYAADKSRPEQFVGNSAGKTLEEKVATNKSVGTNYAKEIFAGQQDKSKGYFPVEIKDMGANVQFFELNGAELRGNGINVSYIFHSAHPGGMIAYKLEENGKKVVFTGDYEHDGAPNFDFGTNDRKIIDFAQGADALVIDGQYTPEEYVKKKGWGHSNIERIYEIAVAAKVKKLYVTHHDPMHTDKMLDEMQERTRNYMANVIKQDIPVTYAREGMTLEVV